MIEKSRSIPINAPSEPVLTRKDVWAGLEMKANNALPFVPAMSHCKVLERQNDNDFVREIEFRGERCRERVALEPERMVRFERLDGSVLGTIHNFIEETEDGLALRFSFRLQLAGVPEGSDEETAYGEIVEKDYLKAVDATLEAIRRRSREGGDPVADYYAAVDRLDLETFRTMHTEDSVVYFGNNPPVEGRDAVAEAIGGFWQTIGGMRHTFLNRWDVDDRTILDLRVDYTRKDGALVSVPCVSMMKLRDRKVSELRVFIDLTPVFA